MNPARLALQAQLITANHAKYANKTSSDFFCVFSVFCGFPCFSISV